MQSVTMMYFMGKNNEYIGHISTLENAEQMAQKIMEMMDVGSPSFIPAFVRDKLTKQ